MTSCSPSAPLTRLDRQPLGVVHGVVLLLPAVGRQRLPEVAVAVEQADADDRHPEVGGRLQVVTGQDAEAAGVVRQHLGDAELHREVGDGRGECSRRSRLLLLVPARLGQVRLQIGVQARAAGRGTRRRPASSSRRAVLTDPSSCSGSPPTRFHRSRSMSANRSWLAGCHDHRRLRTRDPSGRSAAGSCGRTLKRRSAFTHRKLVHVRHRGRSNRDGTPRWARFSTRPGAPDRDGRRRGGPLSRPQPDWVGCPRGRTNRNCRHQPARRLRRLPGESRGRRADPHQGDGVPGGTRRRRRERGVVGHESDDRRPDQRR